MVMVPPPCGVGCGRGVLSLFWLEKRHSHNDVIVLHSHYLTPTPRYYIELDRNIFHKADPVKEKLFLSLVQGPDIALALDPGFP